MPTTSPPAASVAAKIPDIFGDGSDGDVTIAAGTTTLTRDMQYDNLIVNGTIEAKGWRVFVRGTLTGAGTIRDTANGNLSAAGYYTQNGNWINPGASTSGVGNAAGTPGTGTQLGGQGGAGGAGTSGAGGSTASNGISAVQSGVALTDVAKIHPIMLLLGRGFPSAATPTGAYTGGTGGGSGAGDGSQLGARGGRGGGVVVVFAYDASGFTGTINADGEAGQSSGSGNTGGGGGGGGGLAALFSTVLPTGAYTISAAAGTFGTKTGTGVNGSAGSAGTTIAKVI